MIEAPKLSEEQQKQLRYDIITMIEEYPDQDALQAFRQEWDGAVHFKIEDDHTVVPNIAGDEKLPLPLKEEVRARLKRFDVEES
jgi:hypothetical protein